ncbi:hypothetical protein [Paracoccus homiensis]|uniref:Uncharacterized protein n=1 Tax=Paracoccus homiensis TaxID=364199 RepID=A0A1I0J3E2_9RHOB|nr:hypothetical protein [Paracoccus homiensis]SEU03513.1 hypothetical protein SAMN04489858_12075 [Paracoccus homiensis]
MTQIIRDLLTPEAQRDAYTWAAVLVAHFGIGACLRMIGLPLVVIAIGYAGFETMQAGISGVFLPWDSVLDWSAVMLGAVAKGPLAVAALAVIALVGTGRRR